MHFYLSELCQDMYRRPCKLPSDKVIFTKHSSTNWP